MESKKNITFIDISKGIGILLVILGHMPFLSYSDPLLSGIYSFHMPLFFIIAGFLINFEKYAGKSKAFVKGKFYSLIKPYIIFCIISFLFWGIVNNQFPYKYIIGILYGNGTNGWLDFNIPLWFLPSLFFANLIFFFSQLLSLKRNFTVKFVMALCLSIIGYFISKKYFLPFGLDIALASQIFLFFGHALKSHKKLYIKNKVITLLILCLIQILVIYFNGRVDMNGRLFNNIILYYVGGILGSLIIFNISQMLSKIKYIKGVLSFTGTNSLYIMAYHVLAFSILNMISSFISEEFYSLINTKSLITYLYYLIGSVLLSLLIGSLHKSN